MAAFGAPWHQPPPVRPATMGAMAEPIFDHLRAEVSQAWHGITGHLRHHGYDGSQDRPGGGAVSLSSAIATIEGDAREGIQNVISWATQVAETHLPSALADIRAVAESDVFKAIEAAALSPAEAAIVNRFIGDITSLRSQPVPDSAEATADEAQAPAA